jgi:DNA-binding MarR family transcriptional regulator
MLKSVLFYSLEKAIKHYRKFAQARIDKAGISLTIDQWLVLQAVLENDGLTQREIGERVFKDQASVARILALLLSHGLIAAEGQMEDARRIQLRVSEKGHQVLADIMPIILDNRSIALAGLSAEEITQLQTLLERIYRNVTAQKRF